MDFHQTMGGRKFFESDVPAIRKSLELLADTLQEANALKAEELALKKRELDMMEAQLQRKSA